MSMLKIDGTPDARGLRVLWGARKVGASDERLAVTFGANSKKPAYLAITPKRLNCRAHRRQPEMIRILGDQSVPVPALSARRPRQGADGGRAI